MTTLRTATAQDIPEIVELGRMMHFESRYSHLDFSPKKFADLLEAVIPQGLTFLVEDGCRIVGLFVGLAAEHFFGHDMSSYDFLTYVIPERRGRIGYLLTKEYIRRAKALKVKDICIGISTGIDIDTTGRFYERLGFSRIGGSYSMENSDV